jgi:two-component sensor histidine kinase
MSAVIAKPTRKVAAVSLHAPKANRRRADAKAIRRTAHGQPAAFEAEMKALELSHRLKNVLSLVQALVHQSFRNAGDCQTAQRAIEGRIAALSRSHDILCRPDPAPADLADIVSDTAAIHGDAGASAFRICGPTVGLRPEATLFFTLVLHELGTNAVKYGALSTSEGQVKIEWAVVAGPDGDELDLQWTERHGPTVVTPTRRGFGMQLIERMAAATFGGRASVAFQPEGVTCAIRAPLGRIATAA